MDNGPEVRSFGGVVREAGDRAASLARLDLELFHAELKSKASKIMASGIYGIAAAVLFVLGSFALVECLILAIVLAGISAVFACLIVGAVLFVAGLASLHFAKKAIAGWTPIPEQTIAQATADFTALKRGLHHGANQ